MIAIILEGVLFVALVATGGALFFFVVRYYTPLGRRWRQRQNRRLIDHTAERTCPIHGEYAEHELVRLSTGEAMCPLCYKETMYGDLNG